MEKLEGPEEQAVHSTGIFVKKSTLIIVSAIVVVLFLALALGLGLGLGMKDKCDTINTTDPTNSQILQDCRNLACANTTIINRK